MNKIRRNGKRKRRVLKQGGDTVGRRRNAVRNKFAPKTGTSTGGQLNVSIIQHGLRHDSTLYVQNKCEYECLNSEQMAVPSHAKKGRSGKRVDLPLYYEFAPISLNTSHIKVCACPHLDTVSDIMYAPSQNCEKRLVISSCLFVHMKKHGYF